MSWRGWGQVVAGPSQMGTRDVLIQGGGGGIWRTTAPPRPIHSPTHPKLKKNFSGQK